VRMFDAEYNGVGTFRKNRGFPDKQLLPDSMGNQPMGTSMHMRSDCGKVLAQAWYGAWGLSGIPCGVCTHLHRLLSGLLL